MGFYVVNVPVRESDLRDCIKNGFWGIRVQRT